MNSQIQISDAEYEIMEIIWAKNPISTKEIDEEIMKTSNWNVSTIHTLISRLDKKGVISHQQKGKLYFYTPVIKKDEYINSESKSFLTKFFNGAAKKMVMNFIDNKMLTDSELEELKAILDKRS